MSTRSIRPRTEAAQGGSAGLQARLLVLAGDEALVRPGRLERGDEPLLGHHVAAGVAAMELLDGQVERRAVDDGVVRGDRDAHDMDVAVLERAGQVGVDLVEGKDEGLRRVDHGGGRRPLRGGRLEGGEPLDGAGRARGRRRPGREVERLEDEGRDTPRPFAAVVQRVGEEKLVAGPGHPHVEEPPLLLHMGVAAGEDAGPTGPG